VSTWHLTTGWLKQSSLHPNRRQATDVHPRYCTSASACKSLSFQEPEAAVTPVLTDVQACISVNTLATMLVTRLRTSNDGLHVYSAPWDNYRRSALFAQRMACWPVRSCNCCCCMISSWPLGATILQGILRLISHC